MIITTKKVGPTDTKGARVVVEGLDRKLTFSWDHSKNTWDNHWTAARTLAEQFGIKRMAYTDSPDRTGYVFMSANFIEEV